MTHCREYPNGHKLFRKKKKEEALFFFLSPILKNLTGKENAKR